MLFNKQFVHGASAVFFAPLRECFGISVTLIYLTGSSKNVSAYGSPTSV